MDGNDNTERDPTIWVQKTVYSGSDQPPRYEYIKSPTTGSESSPRLDTDTPPMMTVTENADELVTKIAQTTPQIAELCIIKGATLTDQHQIHPIEV